MTVDGGQGVAWLLQSGVEIHASNVTFRPELRYARWGKPRERSEVARRTDEWMILFGISFNGIW